MIEVDGKHTGDLIGEKIFDTIMKYEIGTKLGWITTDNATNNITAMNSLSKLLWSHEIKFNPHKRHIRCINHVINLVVCDFVKTFQKKKKKRIISRLWSLRSFPKRKELVNGRIISHSDQIIIIILKLKKIPTKLSKIILLIIKIRIMNLHYKNSDT